MSVKPIDVKIPLNVRLCGIDGYNDILTVDWQAKKAQINKKIMYANVADLIRDGNAEIDSIQQNGNTYYDIVICNIPRGNGGTAYCTHCPTSTSQNCEMFCVFGENADTDKRRQVGISVCQENGVYGH